jgi:hypothetical protein
MKTACQCCFKKYEKPSTLKNFYLPAVSLTRVHLDLEHLHELERKIRRLGEDDPEKNLKQKISHSPMYEEYLQSNYA